MSDTRIRQEIGAMPRSAGERAPEVSATAFHHLHFDPRARTWRSPGEVVFNASVGGQHPPSTAPRAS